MSGELRPALRNAINHAVSRRWIFMRNKKPDADQVFIGAVGSDDRQHDQALRFICTPYLRRASAFTSSMLTRLLGPLTIPSSHSAGSSSTV